MKNKFSKIFYLLVMVVCCFLFCGCAKIDYGIQIHSNGIVCENVYVKLSQTALQNKGYNSNDLILDIGNVSLNIIDPYITNFVNADILRTKSSQTSINGYKINVSQKVLLNGVPYNQSVILFSIQYTTTEIQIKLEFYSANVYYEFYNVSQEELEEAEEDDILEDNFLFTKKITPGNTVFNKIQDSSITTHFINYFTKENIQDFSLDNVQFNHIYATYDNSLKSNCDYKEYKNNLTYHIWEVNSNNLNKETIFYKTLIKPVYWYVISLGLTVVLILILLLINKINKKRKTKIEIINN